MEATEKQLATAKKGFKDVMDFWFMEKLASTPQGRHHVLSQVADAEAAGEGRIFEQTLGRVDDAKLQRMIQRHQADEIRHSELFFARVDATGIPRAPVPPALQHLDRLDAMLGGVLERDITTREGVMEAYVLLQVIEERAITQFAKMREAFALHDPETAAVFDVVQKDEERHLLYCHAVSKKYAPSEEVRLATLERFRRAEAAAFKENQLANVQHVLQNKLIPGAARRFGWRVFSSLASLVPALPLTRFYGSEERLTRHPALQAA